MIVRRHTDTRRRILVIDDDWTTRETFRHMLLAEGYEAVAAASVDEGVQAIAAEIPDALLLDLHMPLLDGLACLRQLRSVPAWAGIPVAILTGDYFIDETVASELRSLHAVIHFKPVWEDDLRRLAEQLLSPDDREPCDFAEPNCRARPLWEL
jgi:two-component system, chemotaxis family, chemotaxis protein CheY